MNNLFRCTTNLSRLIPLTAHLRFRHKKSFGQRKAPCTGKSEPLMEFQCKFALITGGADGIGLTIAHELLSEKAQNVALIGNNNCKGREAVNILNCSYGKNKALFINCDVQNKAQVAECFKKVIKEFGKLDILVNAAGIFDDCNWEKEITTNLSGTIHSMLEAYKVMSKEGVILNLSGLYGIKPLPSAPILSAVYHAIVGLSRSLGDARNVQRSGIRVVTLCPGITNTNFVKNAEKRALNKEFAKDLEVFLTKVKRQNAETCGKSALHAMRYGNTGSVWVVVGSKLYSLNIPHWKKYRVLESQLL